MAARIDEDAAISTRTPHAGSDPATCWYANHTVEISTRTPHAGSDAGWSLFSNNGIISTRTPHAGSDRNIMRKFTASINI